MPAPNTNFIAVAAGGWHSLGLKADGTIVAWGLNDEGQTTVPAPNTNFIAVAAGTVHSLGLKADGTIVAWGRSFEGQIAVPTPNTNFIAVAAGEYHSMGLKADGTIVAWGWNDDGQTSVPPPNADFGVNINSGVAPDSGSAAGGYPVVISGTDLGGGSDITNVTLCGASVSSIDSQSATQIVVTAAVGPAGLGDVRVFSTSQGETVKSNAFTYLIANQTITFPAIGNRLTTDAVGLAATASSGRGHVCGGGLAVTFAVGSGPASIAGGTNLTFSASGSVRIVASQAGNASYNAAPDVTNTFNVTKAAATVVLGSLSHTNDGTAKSATATTVPGGLAMAFTYDGSATAPTAVGRYAVTGTVNDAMYKGSAAGTLFIDHMPMDTYEFDSALSVAKPIGNGERQARNIHFAGNEDWAKFTVKGLGATSVKAETSGASGDTEMWLYRADGRLAAYDNDSGAGDFSLIRVASLTPGIYTLRVREYGNNEVIPAYTLRVVWTTVPIPADTYEEDDTSPHAKSISNGETQARTIHAWGKFDWATFRVGSRGARDLVLQTAGTSGDTQLWIYRENSLGTGAGFKMAYDDNSGGGKFSKITRGSMDPGTYYIKIQENGNNSVIPAYTLKIDWATP